MAKTSKPIIHTKKRKKALMASNPLPSGDTAAGNQKNKIIKEPTLPPHQFLILRASQSYKASGLLVPPSPKSPLTPPPPPPKKNKTGGGDAFLFLESYKPIFPRILDTITKGNLW